MLISSEYTLFWYCSFYVIWKRQILQIFTYFHRTIFRNGILLLVCITFYRANTMQTQFRVLPVWNIIFFIFHCMIFKNVKIDKKSPFLIAHHSKWYFIVCMHRLLQETKKTIRCRKKLSGSCQPNASFVLYISLYNIWKR